MTDGFRDYLFTYRHNGAQWGIEIRAESPEDAKARLKSLAWAKYDGEVMATIPVAPNLLLRWFDRVRSFCLLNQKDST